MLCSFEQWCLPEARSSNQQSSHYSSPELSTTTPVSLSFLFLHSREQERWNAPVQAVGVVVGSVRIWRILHLSSLWLGNGLECCQRKLVQRWDGQNEQCIYPFQFFHNGLFYINLQSGTNLYVRLYCSNIAVVVFFSKDPLNWPKGTAKTVLQNISISKNHGGKSISVFFFKQQKFSTY